MADRGLYSYWAYLGVHGRALEEQRMKELRTARRHQVLEFESLLNPADFKSSNAPETFKNNYHAGYHERTHIEALRDCWNYDLTALKCPAVTKAIPTNWNWIPKGIQFRCPLITSRTATDFDNEMARVITDPVQSLRFFTNPFINFPFNCLLSAPSVTMHLRRQTG